MSSVPSCEGHPIDDSFQHKTALQEKALCQWERQQHAWTRMQENLRRRIGPRGGTNMTQSSRIARSRDENLSLLHRSSPNGLFSGPDAWPSSLRSGDIDGMVRYVKLGRSNFPYPLYTKVIDKRRVDFEGSSNTRVVYAGQGASLDKKHSGRNKQENQSFQDIDNEDGDMREEADEGAFNEKSASLSTAAARVETPVFLKRGDGYYKQQLQRHEAFLQESVPHLMLPRAYLEVCGGPPPRTTCREDWIAGERKGPAVTSAPPPTPSDQPKELATIVVPSTESVIGSRTISNMSAVDAKTSVREGPYLEVSTTRVLFIARPGELAHGTAVIRNGGTTTVYYTWVPLDSNPALGKEDEEEQRQQLAKSSKEYSGSKGFSPNMSRRDGNDNLIDDDDGNNNPGQESVSKMSESLHNAHKSANVTIGSKLRALSTKSIEARSYFCFSSPSDGVILPGEEGVFSFSVRSPITGRFTQHYEVLMIPVTSPLIIELSAIIFDADLPTSAIARPIASALDTRAVSDAQRQTINAIAADSALYEASEIRQATKAHLSAAGAAANASRAQHLRWRAAWNAGTHTPLSLPFNRDVYARLDALHGQLVAALSALSVSLPPRAAPWDGSVRTLQALLCRLRDAPARHALREALAVLLRAAGASAAADEPLALLLRRVAGGDALAALARRAGEAADAADAAVGLRAAVVARPPAGRKAAAHRPSGRALGKSRVEEPALPDPADPAVQAEREAWMFAGMKRAVADAVDRLCAGYDSARMTVEAACYEPVLEVTQSARAEDVRAVQAAEDMEVDHTVDAIPLKKKR